MQSQSELKRNGGITMRAKKASKKLKSSKALQQVKPLINPQPLPPRIHPT
jgi:hypothetical protein